MLRCKLSALNGTKMATVVCVGTDDVLMHTRKMILERAGHRVLLVKGQDDLVSACRDHPVQVAVLGQNMERTQKLQAFSAIRNHCPSAKVLSLYRVDIGRSLPDADDWLEVPADVPTDLAERVSKLART